MYLRVRQSFNRKASTGFIVICFTLLLGGLFAGTLYLVSTIKPVPLLPQVGVEEVA